MGVAVHGEWSDWITKVEVGRQEEVRILNDALSSPLSHPLCESGHASPLTQWTRRTPHCPAVPRARGTTE